MSSVRIFIKGEDGGELPGRVETSTIDDFHYFRDSVHAALETGEFGSRFPTFMRRYEMQEWTVDELDALHRELSTIIAEFKKLPPKPLDGNWKSKLAFSGRKCVSLYEVFVDANGRALLGALLELCDMARKAGRPIVIDSD